MVVVTDGGGGGIGSVGEMVLRFRRGVGFKGGGRGEEIDSDCSCEVFAEGLECGHRF